jgi:hypothetical protein
MKCCILISAFCILTSVGLCLDVSVDTIPAPSGTVDSGQSVIPRMVIRNLGNEPADSVNAYFIIDDGQPSPYADSITGFHLDALATETLAFGGFIPRGRDSMTATAWIHCPDDTNPANDTFRQQFLVRVKDVAVVQIITPPPDTVYDSGVVFYPSCRIWNYGNWDEDDTCIVGFRIGDYYSACTLYLAPTFPVVTAPDPYTTIPGIWPCQVSATVRGDLHPENNIMVDTFTVRGTISVDVDARAVLAPTGVIDTTQTIMPRGRFGNNGSDAASFWAFFCIRNSGGAEIYAESSQAMINGGEETEIEYPAIKFSVLGNYTAICSTAMPGDQNSTNDVKKVNFRVAEEVLPGDIGVVRIVAPSGHLLPDSSFIPTAVWRNYSDHPMGFDAFFMLHNKYGVRMYSQSQADVPLNAGEEVTLHFPSFNVGNDTGLWGAFCSTFAVGDTNPLNDTLRGGFLVGSGIEENPGPQASSYKPEPTVVRGVLRLPVSLFTLHSSLFAMNGRKVMALRPGANDVTRLAPGVYFMRAEPVAAGPRPSAVRKVVIQH